MANLNPQNTMCICKHNGKEVGRIAATAPNAAIYMEELARQYKDLDVTYVEDKDAAMINRMFSRTRF